MATENWLKVKEILAEVVRQKPEERQQFLERVCEGGNEIHHEVESLLSAYNRAASFMELPAVVEIAETFEAGMPQLASGQLLGHYEIIEQIGKGGMGEVYLAHDKKLDRQVAIKILYEKFSQHESNLQRFIREAKTASGLNHQNILVIHEIGETEKAHYIVSEHVEGKTLREFTKEKTLKLSGVLDLSVQIAGALSAAHEAHLVHRDIKPENIMIRPDGFVKILDFGLAKLIEVENETTKQNQTAKGMILGTVNYMSPEQARGQKVDERTDIFSFGVVLYELITGHRPFAGDSTNETIAAILKSEPEPMASHVADVPPEMESIVSKALRKNPDDRYQNIKDLLKNLQDLKQELEFEVKLEQSVQSNLKKDENESNPIYEGDSVRQVATRAGQNISLAEYIANIIRRHRSTTFLGLTILVIAFAGYGYFTFFADVNDQIESIAVMPFVNESGDQEVEYLSDGLTETLISSLSEIPSLSVKARSSVFLYKGKEVSPKNIGEELNVQAVLLGRVVKRGEDLTLKLELVDARTENILWSEEFARKMRDLVALQSEIAREVSSKLRIELTSTEQEQVAKTYTKNSEAQELYLRGRFHWNKRNTKDFEKAIEYFKQATEKDPNYALAYTGLADTYHLMPMHGKFRHHEYMPLAKKAALKALKLDDNLAEAHASYGEIIFFYDYDWEGAEHEYKRAIELDPEYATAHHWYAYLLINEGRYDEAVREMSKAIELEPSSIFYKIMLGNMSFFARRYDEAIVQYKKVIELDPGKTRAIDNLAGTYEAKGMYSEAVELYLLAKKQKEYNDVYLLGKMPEENITEQIQKLEDAYKRAGWEGFKRVRIEIAAKQREDDLEKDKTAYIRSRYLAYEYADLKDKEKTLGYLNKAFEERDYWLVFLRGEYKFDFVRDDPRFKELVRKIGIPE